MLFAITQCSIDEQMVKKSDPVLIKLIETYKRGQAKFSLARKDIPLTDHDIGVIFGITSGPVKIHIATHGRRPDTEFANRVFAGASTVHLSTMRVTIENILKPPVKKKQKKKQKQVSEIEAAKDLARLLTLYTIGTLFFPTTGPNLNWSYLKLVEDLENSANYNWSMFITNNLVNELNSKNPAIVGGCTTALLYWLCEHTHIMEPAQQTFPKFMKWKMNELAAKLLEAPLSSLPEGMVKQEELELTERERGLFAALVLHEQKGTHKKPEAKEKNLTDQEPLTQEENPQEENQDVKNLILELEQRIKVLEEENNVMKVEIEDRDKKIQERDLLIVELRQNVESLQHELSGYRKQNADYTDIEKKTCSLHVEVEMLKEDIIENEVEIGGLYVEKDIAEEKIEEVTEELHDIAAHCVSQHYKDQKIIEELQKQKNSLSEQKQSENVHHHESPIHDKEVTEEEIDQMIKSTISSIQAEPQQTTKKRLRKGHTVDPSSLTKRVSKREDRKEKNMEDFQVYGKKKSTEKQAEKAAPELPYMGVETTKLAHLVPENDKIFLNHIFECEKDIRLDNNLFDGTESLQEVIEILNEKDVQNTLIDSFTFILEREQGDESKILFFKSILWSLLKDQKNEVRKMFLDDKLLELIQKQHAYRYLVFPMNSSGGNKENDNDPYHWTVLVYDIEDGQWRHYNSIRPTGRKADAYLKDARLMKRYVEGFVKKNHTPTFILSSQNETIFEKQKFDAPIISPASPQQRPGTVDCGIIVCYIIDKLAHGESIPESLTTDEIREYRVLLLMRFLYDEPRTWTEALWKDRNLKTD
ncbi:uncharacterized protein LOC131327801 [Rhododendron vialii]|uniref:uncharacterized protein LOC131327801 n=1 Tax=Rhododendron vialii TaxID=182163 RepID=UPI00265DBEE3|nr:uncharacterized protein LOC131327801 [Rhododendron vialii]